jgi:cephalosporin hydroxylase
MEKSIKEKYSYNFTYLSRPIIQYPQDIVAMQEIIWKVQPDLIIETGIAHGGSIILSASMLALLEYSDAVRDNITLDPANPKRKVLAIDIDIRKHNKDEILKHPMASRIDLIEGSSIDDAIIKEVHSRAKAYKNILVFLDSNHTHSHVLSELIAYAPLVTPGSYCVVFDSIIEDLPADQFEDRPWGRNDNPKTALHLFLNKIKKDNVLDSSGNTLNFIIDKDIENKLQFTVAPDGFLKRI